MLGWLANVPLVDSVVSLARDISLGLGADGKPEIEQRFVPELQQLRSPEQAVRLRGKRALRGGSPTPLPLANQSMQFEIRATVRQADPHTTDRIGFFVRASNDFTERTEVGVDVQAQLVYVDRSRSGTAWDSSDTRAGPLVATPARHGSVHFHIIVDGPIVTVIVNNRTALTVSVLPRDESVAVAFFATTRSSSVAGGLATAPLFDIDAWNLQSAG